MNDGMKPFVEGLHMRYESIKMNQFRGGFYPVLLSVVTSAI